MYYYFSRSANSYSKRCNQHSGIQEKDGKTEGALVPGRSPGDIYGSRETGSCLLALFARTCPVLPVGR